MTGEEFFHQADEALTGKRIHQALKFYQLAEELGHDADGCAAGRWNCYMLSGEFESAWRESDGIAQRGKPDPNRFWDRLPLVGRHVLLRCLHGLGDTLQFIRYAPLIRRQARSFTIEAQPKLKPLLEQASLADRVITWGEAEPFWDQQLEVMELPYIFRTTLESIPRHVPYIQPGSEYPVRHEEANGLLRVGIVWASGRYNPARSIPIETVARLFDTPGVSFVSLQAGEEASEAEPWADRITILPDEYTGILATAQTIKTLDLVITVDTMTTHLAGAVGSLVWTLLPFESDWRWMIGRLDSPWYPTMRLFRQQQDEDWNCILEAVKRELMAWVADRAPYHRGTGNSRGAIPVREP